METLLDPTRDRELLEQCRRLLGAAEAAHLTNDPELVRRAAEAAEAILWRGRAA